MHLQAVPVDQPIHSPALFWLYGWRGTAVAVRFRVDPWVWA